MKYAWRAISRQIQTAVHARCVVTPYPSVSNRHCINRDCMQPCQRRDRRQCVQTLALHAVTFVCPCSLGLLVRKVKESSVEDIAGRLAEKLTSPSKKNVNRDIAGIALKAVIAEIGSGHPAAPAVARVVTPKMLDGLRQQVYTPVLSG